MDYYPSFVDLQVEVLQMLFDSKKFPLFLGLLVCPGRLRGARDLSSQIILSILTLSFLSFLHLTQSVIDHRHIHQLYLIHWSFCSRL